MPTRRHALPAALALCLAAAAQAPAPAPPPPPAPAVFNNPLPPAQTAFLAQADGTPSGSLSRGKRLRKLMDAVVPASFFHYGRDMPLAFALQSQLGNSTEPARLRAGRYLMLSSSGRQRAFLWIDLAQGDAIGGIFFRPSNGEPTPTLTLFSRQVKADRLGMSQLPAAFAADLAGWQRRFDVPRITPRYFITGANRKILLEHDEDYCAPGPNGLVPAACAQSNADAAEVDLNAAYYLDQTHHSPNATARMIFDPEQVAWFQLRDRTCLNVSDPLPCRIRFTRERVRLLVIRRAPHPRGR